MKSDGFQERQYARWKSKSPAVASALVTAVRSLRRNDASLTDKVKNCRALLDWMKSSEQRAIWRIQKIKAENGKSLSGVLRAKTISKAATVSIVRDAKRDRYAGNTV